MAIITSSAIPIPQDSPQKSTKVNQRSKNKAALIQSSHAIQNETKSNNKLLEHLVVAFADENKKVNTQATPNTKVMNPKVGV